MLVGGLSQRTPPHEPAVLCSACGHGCPENRFREKFTFVSCGHREQADLNAARNVSRAGLAQGESGVAS